MVAQVFWDVFLGEPEDGGSMVIRNIGNIYLSGNRESVANSMEQSPS
jgi:hypothetical protein